MKIPQNIESQKPKQHKPWKRRVWFFTKIAGGLTVLLVALGLIFNRQLSDAYIRSNSKPANYLKVSAKQMKENAKRANKHGNFNSSSAKPVSSYNVLKAAMTDRNHPMIGGISVPALGINLPILADDSEYNMFYGAGPLQAGQEMGKRNYTLASHDMYTNAYYYSNALLFSPLKVAKTGQLVYITDKEHVYTYKINSVQRVLPSAWDEATHFDGGTPIITLITCDTDDKYRVMVRGKLVEKQTFNKSTAKPFEGNYNQYKAYR